MVDAGPPALAVEPGRTTPDPRHHAPDVAAAPPLPAPVLDELGRRVDGALFTAHNADFDAEFLERAARRSHVPLDLSRRLCTLQLSRRLDPERQLTHGLADVCARYGITIERHHDALSDARATAAVLPYLLAANGVEDLADLDELYSPYRVSTR